MRIVIFSGTTEGRKISEYLSSKKVNHDVCVATESGEEAMKPSDFSSVNVGRLDEDEIKAYLIKKEPELVIDATHPYASIVTGNLITVCSEMNIEYIRVNRECVGIEDNINVCSYDNAKECAKALCGESGNIFLTTGSKELSCYMECKELTDRIFVRVLPSEESIKLCKNAGISEKNIIAIYGPHTKDMNEAIIRQFNIKHLVTKESGLTGGFHEKVDAALAAGIKLHVINRPDNLAANADGVSVKECINRINDLLEISGEMPSKLNMKLAGIGPGNATSMTVEVKNAIEEADYIFGASRMLDSVVANGKKIAEYMPEAIIDRLADILSTDNKETINVVALFSGDTGIYSGATNLYHRLSEWGGCEEVSILPGISSFAYFASILGTDYRDAYFESLHGKSDDKENLDRILELIRDEKKVFLLMSGKSDFSVLKRLLPSEFKGKIIIGVNLSYDDQQIIYSGLHKIDEDLSDINDGLIIVMIDSESDK